MAHTYTGWKDSVKAFGSRIRFRFAWAYRVFFRIRVAPRKWSLNETGVFCAWILTKSAELN